MDTGLPGLLNNEGNGGNTFGLSDTITVLVTGDTFKHKTALEVRWSEGGPGLKWSHELRGMTKTIPRKDFEELKARVRTIAPPYKRWEPNAQSGHEKGAYIKIHPLTVRALK